MVACDDSWSLLQLSGRLIRQALSYQVHSSKLPVSRTHTAVAIKGLVVELQLLPELRVIRATLHAKNATGLLRQVRAVAYACMSLPIG